MSGYAVRAAVLNAMDEQGLRINQVAARLRVSPDHLAIRLGDRGPLTGFEIRELGRVLNIPRQLATAAREPARTV